MFLLCRGRRRSSPFTALPILGPAPAPPPRAVDYSRIEFTDLRVEQENDAMAVQYLPFLRAGHGVVASDCCEMSTSPRGDKPAASSDGSTSRNASASTASTVSEDRAVSSSAEAAEKPLPLPDLDEATTAPVPCRSPDTPTSRGGKAIGSGGIEEQEECTGTSPRPGIN